MTIMATQMVATGAAPSKSPLRLSIATTEHEVRLAQELRFRIFNLELGEGLKASAQTGRDADPFDKVCNHILIWDDNAVIGTYRAQTGRMAAASGLGYYGSTEFDFGPFEPIRDKLVELGRACVDGKYRRDMRVLGLLWQGIADYAKNHGAKYLCGCSSLTSQDPAEGAAMYEELRRKHLAPVKFRTVPTPKFVCSMEKLGPKPKKIPKLLRAYLSLGATICGPPALDDEFKTIDFMTLLDLDDIKPVTWKRYFGKDLVR